MEACAKCQKTRCRSEEELRKLNNRLSRIEGQVRGLREMLGRDAYCIDVLTQVSAVSAALDSFSRELLSEHIRTCVANGLREGDETVVDELITALGKLRK